MRITQKNNSILNYDIDYRFKFHSDLHLITITINIDTNKKHNKHGKKGNTTGSQLNPSKYKKELHKQPVKVAETIKEEYHNVDELYELLVKRIKTAIQRATEELETKEETSPKSNEYNRDIIMLQKKRAQLLKIKRISVKEKVEFHLISKTIRSKIREKDNYERNNIIQRTIEGNKNIKKMKRELNNGIQWTAYFRNNKDKKIYNRKEINEIITQCYTKLYKDDNKPLELLNIPVEDAIEPEFLEKEVQTIIKNLKPNKSPGYDKITNEDIKEGGRFLVKTLKKIFNIILKSVRYQPTSKQYVIGALRYLILRVVDIISQLCINYVYALRVLTSVPVFARLRVCAIAVHNGAIIYYGLCG